MKEIQIECPACKGTGLYQGMCEQDGCAVVCTKCGGKGYTTFQYNEFTGKKVKEGIKRVFGKTCGIVHGPEDYKCEDGTVLHFSQYGCTYGEWLNGKEPRPMEELCCPYLYYNKGIGNEPLEKCRGSIDFGSRIYDCKHYKDKAKCWKELHDLQENEKHDIVEERKINMKKGFTLAEFLIELAVIAVVIALLVPMIVASNTKEETATNRDRLDSFSNEPRFPECKRMTGDCTVDKIEITNDGAVRVTCK